MRTAPETVQNLVGQRKPELPARTTPSHARPVDADLFAAAPARTTPPRPRKRRTRAAASLSIYCDGACAPINPGGTATWGYVVVGRTQDSGIVGTGAAMSNNLGEFTAAAMALAWVARHRPPERLIRLHADSKLVVEQLAGRWRMRGGLYVEEYRRAAALVEMLRVLGYQIEFVWVPRAQNRQADALTKQALAAAGG